jgi:hypothetical protein
MNDPSPRLTLSVLTPSFNYAEFIGDCIASVRLQDSAFAVQHVIVDDGSADGSWDIVRANYPDAERDCVQQSNRGLAATLNRALSIATGDWILWLNADDFLLPHTFRLAERALARHPGADLIFGDTIFVDASSRFLRLVAQPRFDRRLLEGGYNMFHTPSVIWRRDLLTTGDGWDESMKLLMDLDLWLTVTQGDVTVVKVDAPLSAFRRHRRQISATARETDIDELRTIARKHGIAQLAEASRVASRRRAKLAHGWRKSLDGGWFREWRAQRYVGRRMDWMNGYDIPGFASDPVGMSVQRHRSDSTRGPEG